VQPCPGRPKSRGQKGKSTTIPEHPGQYCRHTRDGNVVLEYDLIRRFLEMLERTFQTKRRYEFRHGAKTSDGLKSCQEITIAKIAVQNLADFCIGKQSTFQI